MIDDGTPEDIQDSIFDAIAWTEKELKDFLRPKIKAAADAPVLEDRIGDKNFIFLDVTVHCKSGRQARAVLELCEQNDFTVRHTKACDGGANVFKLVVPRFKPN